MTEADAPFEIRDGDGRLLVVWRGRWDEPAAQAYAEAMNEKLSALGGNKLHLVVDASRLQHCNILARGRLADLHEEIAPKIGRCVYIATSPRMRGLCLWIVKVAGDETAKVFANDRDVEEWLSSSETRVGDAQRRIMGSLNTIGSEAN